jgi:hypothetical protein
MNCQLHGIEVEGIQKIIDEHTKKNPGVFTTPGAPPKNQMNPTNYASYFPSKLDNLNWFTFSRL